MRSKAPALAVDAARLEQKLASAAAARRIRWLFEPHEAQWEILRAKERFLVAAMGRRFGKSMIATRWIVEEAIRTQGLTWWIAPTYAASMRAWADLIKYLPRDYRIVKKGERRIDLLAGGSLEFKSADNPDALRGAGLTALVADEAAYIQDYVWTDVLQPMFLTTLGRVLAISTPRAKKGWFYQLWQAGQRGQPDHHAWQMATSANPFVPPAEIARLRESLPESVFQREILAQFLDELASVFTGVRERATAERLAPEPGGDYRIGVDWGRRNDFTVIAVGQVLANRAARMVELVRFTDLPYSQQMERLEAVVAAYQPTAVLAEQNSMGGPLVELLQERGLPLSGFTTTAQSKPPLIQQLQLGLQQRSLELLRDEALIAEFEDYEEEVSDSGVRSFNAPPRQHDDTIIATALMWRLIDGEPGAPAVGTFVELADHLLLDSGAPGLPGEGVLDDPTIWL